MERKVHPMGGRVGSERRRPVTRQSRWTKIVHGWAGGCRISAVAQAAISTELN